MKQLPNIVTLGNLFCGCGALLCIFNHQPVMAAWFTLGCFLCDYADGMVARALHVSSPLGKELDSLADVVSFGAVPGAMLYELIAVNYPGEMPCLVAMPAFILSMFAAYRLGKFNLDTRQTHYFIGLTTPGATFFLLGLNLAIAHDRFGISAFMHQPWVVYVLVAGLSALMISEIPLFGMKIKKLDIQSNLLNFTFVALFAVAVWLLKELALPAIVLVYILVSVALKNKVVAES